MEAEVVKFETGIDRTLRLVYIFEGIRFLLVVIVCVELATAVENVALGDELATLDVDEACVATSHVIIVELVQCELDLHAIRHGLNLEEGTLEFRLSKPRLHLMVRDQFIIFDDQSGWLCPLVINCDVEF